MQVRFIGTGYIEAAGIRLLAGQTFDRSLVPTDPVLVVSQRAARLLWHDEPPVGKLVQAAIAKGTVLRVMGVVDDVRHRLNQPPEPTIYLSSSQFASLGDTAFIFSARDTAPVVGARVRQVIDALSAPAVVTRVMRAEALVDRSMPIQLLALRATQAASGGVMAAAVLSIVSLVSMALSMRRKEHAIRAALGMSPVSMAAEIARQWMAFGVAAIVIGGATLIASDRAAANAIAGVRLIDVQTFSVAAGFVLAVIVCAVAWPTYRAAVASPEAALRVP
jgi:hypothetical protein